jgi:hypothetical protein
LGGQQVQGDRRGEKIKCESFREVDTRKGRYKPFRKIWEDEGLDEAGFVATVKYVSKAMHMNGKWLRWNGMTERHDILHLEFELTETMEKCWKMYTERTRAPTAAAASSSGSPSAAGAGAAAETEPSSGGGGKPKPGGKPGAKHKASPGVKGKDAVGKVNAETTPKKRPGTELDPDTEAKKARKDFDEMAAKSFKLRAAVQTATAQYHAILSQIDANPDLEALSGNTKMLNPAASTRNALDAAGKSAFAVAFMASSAKTTTDLKKILKDYNLMDELSSFNTEVEPLLNKFKVATAKLDKIKESMLNS